MYNKDTLVNLEHLCKAGRNAILPNTSQLGHFKQVKKGIKTLCSLSLILSFALYSPAISFAAIDHIGNYDGRTNNTAEGNGGVFNLSTAIYNSIQGNYSNNTATNSGGALYISGTSRINSIYGDFTSNTITTAINPLPNVGGGAIYNNAYIGGIYGDFTNNIVGVDTDNIYTHTGRGGAIFNTTANNATGYIGTISGTFKNNIAYGSSENTGGGAIYNDGGTIVNILGEFKKNTAGINETNSSNGNYHDGGGAIHNFSGYIGNIIADFTENRAANSNTGGGAIYNYAISAIDIATIDTIKGTFTKNSGNNMGGAIHNSEFGVIHNIDAIFKDNFLSGSRWSTWGGALYNRGRIGSIKGTFKNNYLDWLTITGATSYGGAIANVGTGSITSIIADFIGNGLKPNSTTLNNVSLYGGALYNDTNASIGTISGNFSSNYATANVNTTVAGGAIYNTGAISNLINSSFTGNTVTSSYNSNADTYGGTAKGGAIVNTGADAKIGTIEASFSNNKAQVLSVTTGTTGTAGSAYGGAIYNDTNASIDSIVNSSFNNNSVIVGSTTSDSNSHARGGAIYNDTNASIGSILNSIFSYNTATAGSGGLFNTTYRVTQALGGAIYNTATIDGNIDADFSNNSVSVGSYGYARGGAIYNTSAINGNILGNFSYNSVNSSSNAYVTSYGDLSSGGGAIYNSNINFTGTIEGTFTGNTANVGASATNGTTRYWAGGGALYNAGKTGNIIANFYSNSTNQLGGAILNTNAIGTISGNFIGNSANFGGAIYTTKDMNFAAHNTTYEFTNNWANGSYNAIHVDAFSSGTNKLAFNMTGTGGFIMNDTITGSNSYPSSTNNYGYYILNLIGQDKANNTFALNASVTGANNVNITNATLSLGSFLHNNNTTITTGSVNASSISFTNADLALDLSAHKGSAFLTASNSVGSGNINVGASSTLTLNRVTASASPILIARDETSTNDFWLAEDIITSSLVNTSIYAGNGIDPYANGERFEIVIEINTDHEIFDTEFSKMSLASVDGTIKNGATLDYMQGLTNKNISTSEQVRLMQGGTRISSLTGTATNAKTAMLTSKNLVNSRFNTADSYSLAQNGKITQLASNGLIIQEKTNNVSVWGMPMFAHEVISDVAVGDFTNNYTTNMYGITAGLDNGFNLPYFDMSRFGLAVNLGTGNTKTYGDYSTIANEFTFYGFTGYGAMQKDKLRLFVDLGYSRTSSDLSYGIDVASYSPNGVKAEVANNVLHLGARAEYALYNKNNIELAPYAGLEFLNINTADYDLQEDNAKAATIFNMQVENQTVFQVPFGAKASKTQISRSDWVCLSQARLGAVLSAGNLSENSYAYAPNTSVNINHITKNFDIITADAGLSFKAQRNHWQFGIDATGQLSTNRLAFGGSLEVEYTF